MQEIWFIENNGTRRRGIEKACASCGGQFVTRVGKKSPIYCSRECACVATQKHEVLVCAQCNTSFTRQSSKKKNSRSGLFFCSVKCKCEAQRIGGIEAIMPPHYGTGVSRYREQYQGEWACARCGYDEFVCGMDLHHVDGDRTNNSSGNLKPLCAPCHRALHLGFWALEELGV